MHIGQNCSVHFFLSLGYQSNHYLVMELILRKGQMLRDIFPAAALPKVFPDAGSTPKRKKLDARKFAGVIKLTDDALDVQRRMRNEWNQDPD
jgi:hypothetical protein